MEQTTKDYIRGYKAALRQVLILLKDCDISRKVIVTLETLLKD